MIGVSIKAIIISKINDLLCHKLLLTLVELCQKFIMRNCHTLTNSSDKGSISITINERLFWRIFFVYTQMTHRLSLICSHKTDNLGIIHDAKMEVIDNL